MFECHLYIVSIVALFFSIRTGCRYFSGNWKSPHFEVVNVIITFLLAKTMQRHFEK